VIADLFAEYREQWPRCLRSVSFAIREAEFGIDPADVPEARFVEGRGCEACRHTGYKGRLAIYEIMPFTESVKELTVQRCTALDIKRRAHEEGMQTLRAAGWQRIRGGVTTVAEVLRVTADTEAVRTPAEAGSHAAV